MFKFLSRSQIINIAQILTAVVSEENDLKQLWKQEICFLQQEITKKLGFSGIFFDFFKKLPSNNNAKHIMLLEVSNDVLFRGRIYLLYFGTKKSVFLSCKVSKINLQSPFLPQDFSRKIPLFRPCVQQFDFTQTLIFHFTFRRNAIFQVSGKSSFHQKLDIFVGYIDCFESNTFRLFFLFNLQSIN